MSERFYLKDNEIHDKETERVFNKLDKRLLNLLNTLDAINKQLRVKSYCQDQEIQNLLTTIKSYQQVIDKESIKELKE